MKRVFEALKKKAGYRGSDNKGSAIIIVLVAVSFVFVLITTIMYVTLSNILMKFSDSRIKDNFYTSEMVVEQMKAGLQNEASNAFSSVYRNTLTYYRNGSGDKSFSEANLSEVYLQQLKSQLESKTDSGKWDADKLKSFVDPDLWVDVVEKDYEAEADGTDIRPHNLEITTNGVTLRNVYIKFINSSDEKEMDQVSIIQTDFTVGNMSSGYAASSTIPDLFDYSIIAGQRLFVKDNTNVTSYKHIYGGDQFTSIGEKNGGTSLIMEGRHTLATKGTVSLNGRSTASKAEQGQLKTGPLATLFAHDIVVNQGSAELQGTTAVFNDLLYLGPGDVKVTGNYIGFGNSLSDPKESSAILLNSKNAQFDSSASDMVVLSGRAFVGENTNSINFAVFDNGDDITEGAAPSSYKSVPTGQSISAKADQVAYLIPPECIGVSVNSTTSVNKVLVGRNPVIGITRTAGSVPDLSTAVSNPEDVTSNPDFKIVDFDSNVYSLDNKPLKDFSPDRRYAVRYIHSQYGDVLAYFYLLMTPEQASAYLDTYYARNNIKSNKYFKFYASDIKTPDNEAYLSTAGQYFTTSGTEAVFHDKTSLKPEDAITSSVYKNRFYSLCAKLEDEGAETLSANNIFDNILKTGVSKGSATPETTVDYATDGEKRLVFQVGTGEDQVLGILTGEKEFNYGGSSSSISDYEKIRLIISTGKVNVHDSYKGMIIAKEDVACDGTKILLDSDRTGLARVLQTTKLRGGGENSQRLIDYFIDGDKYKFALDGIASAEEAVSANSASSNTVDYGTLVHYENYTKK